MFKMLDLSQYVTSNISSRSFKAFIGWEPHWIALMNTKKSLVTLLKKSFGNLLETQFQGISNSLEMLCVKMSILFCSIPF